MNSEQVPVISLKNVHKTFKTNRIETKALNNINLDIMKGDFVTLEGTSGSGKSTLLSVMSMLESYDQGEYKLSGIDTRSIPQKEKLRVRNQYLGIIFQSFQLIPTMTVYENVALPLSFYKKIPAKEVSQKVEALLCKVGLPTKALSYPEELSGGQQQRVAIARALITEPEIILADEPTGNLDSENSDNIIQLLKELNSEGQTILIVTHDKGVSAIAPKNIHMIDGSLIN